jgi:hypothetical protein
MSVDVMNGSSNDYWTAHVTKFMDAVRLVVVSSAKRWMRL